MRGVNLIENMNVFYYNFTHTQMFGVIPCKCSELIFGLNLWSKMNWIQTMTIILSVFGMTSGMMLFLIREIRQISRDISAESKDFHGRLCRLEERYLEIKSEK